MDQPVIQEIAVLWGGPEDGKIVQPWVSPSGWPIREIRVPGLITSGDPSDPSSLMLTPTMGRYRLAVCMGEISRDDAGRVRYMWAEEA